MTNFHEGQRVVVTKIAKNGRVLGWHGAQVVVKLERTNEHRLFAPADLAPLQERAVAVNLKLTPPAGVQEEDVQAASLKEHRAAGFIGLQTSVRYHNQCCPQCGHWFRPSGGTGASPGVPDTLYSAETWPVGLWFAIEQKGPKTALSPAQQLLEAQGRIVVARTAAEGLAATEAMHKLLTAHFIPLVLDREQIAALEIKAALAKAAAREKRTQKRGTGGQK